MSDYKSASERTDADERLLTPPFKKSPRVSDANHADYTPCHITVNGKPYCVAEDSGAFGKFSYPTNCAHATHDLAQEGVDGILKLVPAAEVKIVDGTCGSDPFWQTPEGRARIADEEEMNAMRYERYEDDYERGYKAGCAAIQQEVDRLRALLRSMPRSFGINERDILGEKP